MKLVVLPFPVPLPMTDAVVAFLAALMAFAVRLDTLFAFGSYRSVVLALAIPACVLTPAVFHVFRVYRVNWPYAAWSDILRTVAAAITITLALAIALLPAAFYSAALTIPRSVLALFFLFLLSGIAIPRMVEVSRLRSRPAAPPQAEPTPTGDQHHTAGAA